jgi:[acyl-carrier-protein] S-malonyltransferase
MAKAAAERRTGMVATLGGDDRQVQELATLFGLQVATVNVTGQTVYGGPVDALQAFAQARPGGARVRRLQTAGAFHTSAMAPAVPGFEDLVAATTPRDAQVPVVANADGAVLTEGRALLARLVAQLTGPVRFDLCLATIAAAGVRRVVELAPGGTLTGLAKRGVPDAELVALTSPADVA